MEKAKEQAKALIEELPEELVEGLLGFIRGLQEWEATREILENEEFAGEIDRGLAELVRGEAVDRRDIKRTNV